MFRVICILLLAFFCLSMTPGCVCCYDCDCDLGPGVAICADNPCEPIIKPLEISRTFCVPPKHVMKELGVPPQLLDYPPTVNYRPYGCNRRFLSRSFKRPRCPFCVSAKNALNSQFVIYRNYGIQKQPCRCSLITPINLQ